MRNPDRIPVVMELITKIWMEQPNTRFFQLIHNLQWEYSNKNNGAGREITYKKEEHSSYIVYGRHYTIDLYNLEDGKFIAFLEDKLREEEADE